MGAGDLVLEGKNKRVKMWAPPSVPSERQWLRTSSIILYLALNTSVVDQKVNLSTDHICTHSL